MIVIKIIGIALILLISIDILRAPDMFDRMSEYADTFGSPESFEGGILAILLLYGIVIAVLVVGIMQRNAWLITIFGLATVLLLLAGPKSLELQQKQLESSIEREAWVEENKLEELRGSCKEVGVIPAGKTGDYCVRIRKGETIEIEPPPRTYVELLSSEVVEATFTAYKRNLSLDPVVIDPGKDTWPCLPDGYKDIRVHATKADATLRIRLGSRKTPGYNCS